MTEERKTEERKTGPRKTGEAQRVKPAERAHADGDGEAQRAHTTSGTTVSPLAYNGAQGGTVESRCTCGWTHSVAYYRDRFMDDALLAADEARRAHERAASDA
jgi:hypothetical protein